MRKIADSAEVLSASVPSYVAKAIRTEARQRNIKVSQVVREKLICEVASGSRPILSIGGVSIPLSELDKVKVIFENQEAGRE